MAAGQLEVITKKSRRYINGMKMCHQVKSLVAFYGENFDLETNFVHFFFGDK